MTNASLLSYCCCLQVSSECGYQDIVPKLWIEPLLGVVPGNGWRIDWLGLWADVADGVSVQNLQELGKPRTKPAVGYLFYPVCPLCMALTCRFQRGSQW